ncbi:MAG: trigger factor [Elusimicrobia bacterium]|nr:trigger factor [Elusimicrobiota bacterium]
MAIWTPEQKTKTKKLKTEGCKQVFEVEVPAPKAADAVQTALVRLQLTAKLPGFRPGRVPLDQIKAQFMPRARAQAADDLIEGAVREALGELKLRPVAMPSVGNLKFPEGGPVTFELHIETAPEFEPKGYKGIALAKKEAKASEDEVAERAKQLVEGNARLEAAEGPAARDHYLVIDFTLSRDGQALKGGTGKGELIDLSSDQTVEGLVDGLLGAKKGETREFEVKLDGKPASCSAVIGEIKRKVLPALDDDFAKDLGVENLAQLKEKLAEIVQREHDTHAERDLQAQTDKSLLDANAFEVPASLVEQQLEHMFERLSERMGPEGLPEAEAKKFKEQLAPEAEKAVRLQFIVARVAEKEKVEVTDADLAAELEKTLSAAETEKDKSRAKEFFEKRADEVRAMLKERKVYQLIRESAKVKAEKAEKPAKAEKAAKA